MSLCVYHVLMSILNKTTEWKEKKNTGEKKYRIIDIVSLQLQTDRSLSNQKSNPIKSWVCLFLFSIIYIYIYI